MKATIWHNPKCGTSRKVLEALQQREGVELEVVEYLKQPPAPGKLAQLYRDAGLTPREGLRLRGTDAQERGLPQAQLEQDLEQAQVQKDGDRASAQPPAVPSSINSRASALPQS